MKTIVLLGIALTCGASYPATASAGNSTGALATACATHCGTPVFRTRPVDDIDRFVKQKYPGCRILDKDYDDGLLEVKISHRGIEKILLFDHERRWMRTVWELRREQLPKTVVRALAAIGFAFRNLDDNDNMAVDTPRGRYYGVQVDTDRRDGIYVVSDKGRVVHRYTDDGWNDGRLRGNGREHDWEDEWDEHEWDEREWDDGEDHFDEGDDEWDNRKHKRRQRDDEEDDGEDHFDEGDDEWDWGHREA